MKLHRGCITKKHDVTQTCGKFNNVSALGRSLYWCQALHIMNKDRYQSTSARRALALLNSPQVSLANPNFDLSSICRKCCVTNLCAGHILSVPFTFIYCGCFCFCLFDLRFYVSGHSYGHVELVSSYMSLENNPARCLWFGINSLGLKALSGPCIVLKRAIKFKLDSNRLNSQL